MGYKNIASPVNWNWDQFNNSIDEADKIHRSKIMKISSAIHTISLVLRIEPFVPANIHILSVYKHYLQLNIEYYILFVAILLFNLK